MQKWLYRCLFADNSQLSCQQARRTYHRFACGSGIFATTISTAIVGGTTQGFWAQYNWTFTCLSLILVMLQTSSIAYGTSFSGSYTFNVILPLFRISSELFQRAVDTVDVSILDVRSKPYLSKPILVQLHNYVTFRLSTILVWVRTSWIVSVGLFTRVV